MKPLLLLLSLFLASIALSQVSISKPLASFKVGEVKEAKPGSWKPEPILTLYAKVQSNDTLYAFTYRNIEYTHYDDFNTIAFSSTKGEKDQLYNLFKQMLESKKSEAVEITIGTHLVMAKADKDYLVVGNEEKGYFKLTKRSLDVLFGYLKR